MKHKDFIIFYNCFLSRNQNVKTRENLRFNLGDAKLKAKMVVFFFLLAIFIIKQPTKFAFLWMMYTFLFASKHIINALVAKEFAKIDMIWFDTLVALRQIKRDSFPFLLFLRERKKMAAFQILFQKNIEIFLLFLVAVAVEVRRRFDLGCTIGKQPKFNQKRNALK